MDGFPAIPIGFIWLNSSLSQKVEQEVPPCPSGLPGGRPTLWPAEWGRVLVNGVPHLTSPIPLPDSLMCMSPRIPPCPRQTRRHASAPHWAVGDPSLPLALPTCLLLIPQ